MTTTHLRRFRFVLAMVMGIESLAFAYASFLHTGTHLAFLPSFFQDPRIVGATIVEGLCGVVLAIAAVQITIVAPAAWLASVGAQVFSICADIFGMVLIALGFGPDSPFNFLFHRMGVAILVLVLAALLTRLGRNALRPHRAGRSSEAFSAATSGGET